MVGPELGLADGAKLVLGAEDGLEVGLFVGGTVGAAVTGAAVGVAVVGDDVVGMVLGGPTISPPS